jgi:hypothetical protein
VFKIACDACGATTRHENPIYYCVYGDAEYVYCHVCYPASRFVEMGRLPVDRETLDRVFTDRRPEEVRPDPPLDGDLNLWVIEDLLRRRCWVEEKPAQGLTTADSPLA